MSTLILGLNKLWKWPAQDNRGSPIEGAGSDVGTPETGDAKTAETPKMQHETDGGVRTMSLRPASFFGAL